MRGGEGDLDDLAFRTILDTGQPRLGMLMHRGLAVREASMVAGAFRFSGNG